MSVEISPEERKEIKELFPELSDQELERLITALDASIDKVLDNYFDQRL